MSTFAQQALLDVKNPVLKHKHRIGISSVLIILSSRIWQIGKDVQCTEVYGTLAKIPFLVCFCQTFMVLYPCECINSQYWVGVWILKEVMLVILLPQLVNRHESIQTQTNQIIHAKLDMQSARRFLSVLFDANDELTLELLPSICLYKSSTLHPTNGSLKPWEI